MVINTRARRGEREIDVEKAESWKRRKMSENLRLFQIAACCQRSFEQVGTSRVTHTGTSPTCDIEVTIQDFPMQDTIIAIVMQAVVEI